MFCNWFCLLYNFLNCFVIFCICFEIFCIGFVLFVFAWYFRISYILQMSPVYVVKHLLDDVLHDKVLVDCQLGVHRLGDEYWKHSASWLRYWSFTIFAPLECTMICATLTSIKKHQDETRPIKIMIKIDKDKSYNSVSLRSIHSGPRVLKC